MYRASPRSLVLKRILLACLLAFSISLWSASASTAATDLYCNACRIYGNSYVINPRYHRNTMSHVFYLGEGNRWMGAGAWNHGSFVWAWGEAFRFYNGSVSARAAAGYSGSHTYATSDAFARY